MKPKLNVALKNYNLAQLKKDVIAGIIVSIIALPLSIAFALGCGVSPEKGIYSAIISSIIIGLFGGSMVQITGPTGAFIIIIQSTLASFGSQGLMLTTVMAGIILIIMGLLKLGKLVNYIPTSIITGFTGGIAVTIFTLEVKDFLGFTQTIPSNFLQKWYTYFTQLDEINYISVLLGLLAFVILKVWPKLNKVIPSSFIAIIIVTFIAFLLKLDVPTLGKINTQLSFIPFHHISIDTFLQLLQPSFTIALLIALQALLSAAVTDEMINSKHSPNTELCAQGVANLLLGLVGCIPATGGVARSITNVKNGGKTPIASIIHGLSLLLMLLLFMPLIQYVPRSVLAAIIMQVAYNMFNLKEFFEYKKAPISDTIVLLTTCILTFSFNLMTAIVVGLLLNCILFIISIALESHINEWNYVYPQGSLTEDYSNTTLPTSLLKEVPKGTLVYEIDGPIFFANAYKLKDLENIIKPDTNTIIIRMRSVTSMDVTAIKTLKTLHNKLSSIGIRIIFSHVMYQPYCALTKAGLIDEIGKANFCDNIDMALLKAKNIPCH